MSYLGGTCTCISVPEIIFYKYPDKMSEQIQNCSDNFIFTVLNDMAVTDLPHDTNFVLQNKLG